MPFSRADSPDRLRLLAAAFAIVAAALVSYSASFAVPFLFDDLAAITNNPTIRDFWRWDQILLPPNDGSGMSGRPIVNLSLALNYALGATSPRGYHVFNLALHTACGLVLFGLLRRTLASAPLAPRFGSAALPLAGLIAVLWTVHPLQTESVTCVIQRTELLVGFFYLATLYTAARACTEPGSRRWPALAIASCALGMASKEVMVSAPLLVLLYDRTFCSGSFRAAWQRHRSLHLGLATTWLVLGLLLLRMGGTRGVAAGFGLGVSWWSYALRQCEAIVTYVGLAAFPHPLVLDYGTAVVTDPLRVAPQIAFIVLLAAGTLLALRFRPVLGFLGFGFCAILAPSSSVVPLVTQTAAEHRMYLPLAALLTLALAGAFRVAGRKSFLFAGALGVACVGATAARNRLLQYELALWTQTIAAVPENPRAHASLGLALLDRSRPADALPHFQHALALDPKSAATHQNIGNAYYQLRRFAEAADHFRQVIALDPKFASGHNNLGATLLELRDPEGALAAYRTALQLDPAHAGARQNIARALFSLGRFAAAVPHYEFLQRLRPASPDAHYDLGLALARAGDLDRAAGHFREALRLRPSAISYLNYGRFLASAGRTTDALAAFESALRLQPDLAEAREERARLTR